MRWLRTALVLLLAHAAPAPHAAAQWTVGLLVEETAGIRRTAFPAQARLELPAGRLRDPSRARLLDAGEEIPVQGTARVRWPDGSVRALEVDFNLSTAPGEARALELRYGDELPPAPAARGLSVTEEGGTVQVGRIRVDARAPVLRSVAYRDELVAPGPHGLAVLDDAGVWYRTEQIVWEPVEIVKRGPLRVLLSYRGRVPLEGGRPADVSVSLELPNSKSWVRISAGVEDPDRRLRTIALGTPLRVGEHPWTWDFGTPNGTYGAFRDSTASAVLRLDTGSDAWTVRAGGPGEQRAYEQGTGRSSTVGLWSHLVGGREAVALAVETPPGTTGTLLAQLHGTGWTSFELTPARPTGTLELAVWQHYVSTPVPIGAATSPASMLSPLSVRVR